VTSCRHIHVVQRMLGCNNGNFWCSLLDFSIKIKMAFLPIILYITHVKQCQYYHSYLQISRCMLLASINLHLQPSKVTWNNIHNHANNTFIPHVRWTANFPLHHTILLWFNKVKHRQLQEYRIAKERLKSHEGHYIS